MLTYANAQVLVPLDPALVLGALKSDDAAYVELSQRAKLEDNKRPFRRFGKRQNRYLRKDIPAPYVCPVCATPVANTTAGSADAIRGHIARHLEELADYAAAKKALDAAKSSVSKAQTRLAAALPGIIGLLHEDETALRPHSAPIKRTSPAGQGAPHRHRLILP
ncbi:hypothetical protein GGD65_006303 [Bradyrhizobium sp. CIR18]|uniref:hypothetical protein n=1 Tax=Bradyrhizobium sp. CIR18 TaxID=2663839 RepID=UPI0017AC1F42|nr:hypothetical protein [Bradyrhizobium sp. CIR18]MBB4365237.1 hypothetical protein [Bradyrhizobium sp. CIR18]